MKSLDQNEAVFVGPNENGSLLSDFQNTLRDFLNQLRFKSFPPLHRNVNLVDWEAFRFEHSVYSLVTQPNPKHQAPTTMGLRNGTSTRTANGDIGNSDISEELHSKYHSVACRNAYDGPIE